MVLSNNNGTEGSIIKNFRSDGALSFSFEKKYFYSPETKIRLYLLDIKKSVFFPSILPKYLVEDSILYDFCNFHDNFFYYKF